MPRPPKPEHTPYLDRITERVSAEERARARAAAQVRELVSSARNQTNAAIVDAVAHGVTKEAIREVLGVSYTNIVNRVKEHEASAGLTTSVPKADRGPVGDKPPTEPKVTASRDDTGYTVFLRDLTHPDVGTDLNGTVVYDEDGELKVADAVFNDHQASDPLWADKLWATREVQDAVNNA